METPPADTPPTEPPVVTTPPPVAGGVLQVNIDIRPRTPGVTKIWANTDGKIAVALLSSSSFNALKVDRASITFGAEGNEASLIRCHSEGIYVNRDRRKDLVCLFDLKKASFEIGDVEGVVRGTVEGKPFEGHAPLKVVQHGKKRKHQHDNDRWDREIATPIGGNASEPRPSSPRRGRNVRGSWSQDHGPPVIFGRSQGLQLSHRLHHRRRGALGLS